MPNVENINEIEGEAEVVLESQASSEQQAEAEKTGWIPPSRFKGDAAKFIDADAYLERANSVLPIVNARNRELQQALAHSNQQVATMAETLRQTQAAIDALNESHTEDVKAQVTQAKEDIEALMAEASEAGDHRKIAKLNVQLAEILVAEQKANEPPPKKVEERQQIQLHPVHVAWEQRNPWFKTDPVKGSLAVGIATKIRQENQASGIVMNESDFYVRLDEEIAEWEGKAKGGHPSKTNGGSRGGTEGSRSGNGKSFGSLPADAKAACHDFAKRVVGPKKAHKDMASWEAAYARNYFAQEAKNA